MNTQLILLISIFFFMSFPIQDLKAQSDSTQIAQQSETLLKINPKTGTPFNYDQTRWINNRGFYTENYDWSDPKINNKLKSAIKERNVSRAFLITGSVLLFTAMTSFATADKDPNNYNGPSDDLVSIVIAGEMIVCGSILINLSARSKVNKASVMRMKSIQK